MRMKPLDAPTAARAMRMLVAQVRAHPSYDPATDLVQVPAFIADRVAFEKARRDFLWAVNDAIREPMERLAALMQKFTRRS